MRSLAWMIAFGLFATGGKVITFDNDPPGKTPPGWTVASTNGGAPPLWEVRRDKGAPTPPYVLAQLSAAAGERYPLAVLNSVDMRDGDVSVRLKTVAGKDDRSGGLVFRYQNPENYYLARASARNRNIALYKVENGRQYAIGPVVDRDLAFNSWRILKVSVRGRQIQVYLDHRRILAAADSTFSGAGKVGLWTAGDSVAYFDDFRVTPKR